MQKWLIEAFDAPMRLDDTPPSPPRQGEALLRIHACSLNFADLLLQKGSYQQTPPLPFTPGLEIAGEVLALGPDTQGPAIGSRVACYCGHGGMASMGNFKVNSLIPIPDSMPYDQASAFLIAYGTSHMALSYKARLQAGETLFVSGAAGGVGLTAVEIGHRMGARVIACARGADKLATAQAAGADHLLDADDPDLKAQLKALGGIDVAYDTVGGPIFDAALRAAKPDARLLAIGFAGGTVPQIPANILLVKNVTVIGFWWGAYAETKPQAMRDSLETLLGWYQDGLLRPHISARYPLSQAPQALAALKSRQASGKLVLIP